MANFEWYTILIIIALLSSGAVGAFIHIAISSDRNKRQPIIRRVDVFPTFKNTLDTLGLQRTHITISDGEKDYKYENLQIVQIELAN